MRTLSNLLGFLIVSTLSAVVALWPVAAGYLLYHAISPVTELGRILTLALLLTFGGGLTVVMFIMGSMLFLSGVAAVAGARRY